MIAQFIAAIPKTDTAEVRILRQVYRGRSVIDVRVWFIPKGQAEFIASGKGVAFDEDKLPMLIDALNSAR